ncbi:fatty acyl-CoA reductase wat-like [Anthonomus grandis grandis]|uniref:fatty acyl-CoA reductase wat-like n=1 Tax=Anthonomus grandis grandis TaxID=2921223 RepID=UPI002164FA7A|nr:fatty acyl-CoA reductase wat-like [Anthonomus grandis grandis]
MALNLEESNIQRFYKSSTVFLTGATGFIGKLLLEKILRALPVNKVYILVRSKKDVPGAKRLLNLFQSPVFDLLKRSNASLLEKVSIMDGDLSQPILGLSKENQQTIIDEVDVIFHCAATVRFDEHLKKATTINIKGTKELIDLAKKITKLKTFMYMGTAFSNSYQKEIEEKIYPTKITAENLISMCNSLDEEYLDVLAKSLTAGWPNTYTFTKQVIEDYIQREATELPICICRPSIVLSTASEPVESFTDNVFSLGGLSVLGGLGISRIMYFRNIDTQIIPADFVVNECIAAGWLTGENFIKKQFTNIPVYNITNGRDNPINQSYIFEKMYSEIRRNFATKKMIAYPMVFSTKFKYNYLIWRFFLHTMIGYFFDLIRKIQGKKPRFVAAMKKLNTFQDAYIFFLTTEFLMDTRNTANLLKKMSCKDKKLFNFDVKTLDWESYFTEYVKGLRFYLLKESIDTLPEGRRHNDYLKKVMIAVVFLSIFLVYVVGKILLFRLIPLVFGLLA